MTTDVRPSESRLARRITDWLEPKNWIIAVTLLVGWHTAQWTGVAWGVVGALFAAVIPITFIKSGIRKGHWGDRHVGEKPARLVVMAVILLSVATGIVLMLVAGAPHTMVGLIVSMLVTLAILTAITFAWKISVHQAVSAGACAMLVQTYGPWMALGFLLVIVVGWSRVELRDHTRNQVIAGTILGTIVAAAVFHLAR
ncbi:phosphatase PAP2 family protein [Streptomyces griseoincarnatus]|uniref:Phosphatase PAP2 family protein n=1 Tax=Streptomyces griseoincarnatus TaxID=29305 RepID=A0ABT0W3X1_STRGI|nr:phosphatase PAP2 family protein [Streptomyces griseoincarnatus]MCM2518283.1 phosphatase PAP2 family protein [Streptomyces griseoincarnatus]